MTEIRDAIVAVTNAREYRPKWTASWYALGRAIRELEHAVLCILQEAQYEDEPVLPPSPESIEQGAEPDDAVPVTTPNASYQSEYRKILDENIRRHRNGTVCLDPDNCPERRNDK